MNAPSVWRAYDNLANQVLQVILNGNGTQFLLTAVSVAF